MPTYYIMDLGETMPETVAHEMPSAADIAACRWLPDSELAVYAGEYQRTGFPGGLQWYRRGTGELDTAELQLFSGQNDRRAVDLHRRQQRLGQLSTSRRIRAHAGQLRARGCWAVT